LAPEAECPLNTNFYNKVRNINLENDCCIRPIIEPEFKYFLLSQNYAKTYACNTSFFVNNGLMESLNDSLKNSIESEKEAHKSGKKGKEVLNYYINHFKKSIKSQTIDSISDFFHESDKDLITNSITSFSLMLHSRTNINCSSFISMLPILLLVVFWLLSSKIPKASIPGFAGIFAIIGCVIIYLMLKDKLKKEKTLNYASILFKIFEIIRKNPERIIESNVFVMSIDERDFNPLLFHNIYRRNDGVWCDFRTINNIQKK